MKMGKLLSRAGAGFIITMTAVIIFASGWCPLSTAAETAPNPLPTVIGGITPVIVPPEVMEPEPTTQPQPVEPEPEPHPFTEEEVVMLAQTIYNEAQVLCWYGDQWGVSYQARQAAVGWCALNRYDAGGYGNTLKEILSKPHQFAWAPDAPVTEEMLWLAEDIIDRWWQERNGAQDVGRTLPATYLFFGGDGRENHFREQYEITGEFWDWSLPDPYQEASNE